LTKSSLHLNKLLYSNLTYLFLSFDGKAAKNGHNDVVKLLLAHGANFAIINKQGSNALRAAKHHDFKETRVILTKHVSK
jgi:hypothetical protein